MQHVESMLLQKLRYILPPLCWWYLQKAKTSFSSSIHQAHAKAQWHQAPPVTVQKQCAPGQSRGVSSPRQQSIIQPGTTFQVIERRNGFEIQVFSKIHQGPHPPHALNAWFILTVPSPPEGKRGCLQPPSRAKHYFFV